MQQNQYPQSPHNPDASNINSQQHQQLNSVGGYGAPPPLDAPNSPGSTSVGRTHISGGRFDFEDGGTYCGGWEEGKAHGNGVCTGPKHQGAYSGAWNYGFEVSGVYIWPSGSSFEGQWQNGRRHGLGVETRGRWIYRGEWTSGSKGRYGVRQSTSSTAKYEGTWAGGLQDGYGSETYADGGAYQGQWQEGKRHGYGVRSSAPFGLASHYRPKAIQTSMTSLRSNEGGNPDPAEKRNHRMDDVRGGFVLKAKSDEPPARRNSLVEKTKKGLLSGLKLKKQRSTSDLEKRGTIASGSIRSTVSTASWISTGSSQSAMSNKSNHSESNASFTVDEEQLDPSVTEVYMGEWKRDKRDGYGISERTDGLKYEGEWHNNKKHGYGVTTLRDGTKEEGKYKCNVLITSKKKKHLFLIRSAKFRERIEASVSSSQRASKYALQKADIAVSRTTTARSKGDMADTVADHAKVDSEVAVATAREFAPDFKPSVLDRFDRIRDRERFRPMGVDTIPTPAITATTSPIKSHTSHHYPPPPPNDPGRIQQYSHPEPVTPARQTQFAPQPSIRRASLMRKQESFDYPQTQGQLSPQQQPMGNKAMPNNLNYASTVKTQQQQPLPNQQQQPQQTMPNYNAAPTDQYNKANSNFKNNTPMTNNFGVEAYNNEQFLASQRNTGYDQASKPASYMNNTMDAQKSQGYNNYPYNNSAEMDPSFQQPNSYQLNAFAQQQMNAFSGANQPHFQPNQMDGHTGYAQNQSAAAANSQGIDHFDHYKSVPSRDNSMDRYARAASRLGGAGGSRQPSIDRQIGVNNAAPVPNKEQTPEKRIRSDSVARMATPSTGFAAPSANAKRPSVTSFHASSPSHAAVYSSPNQPFEDVLLRQRTLGQDIIPSPREPKRTESLYLPPKPLIGNGGAKGGGGAGGGKPLKSVPIGMPLSRKKSLPQVQQLPLATEQMSREEVSALGSARREEVRRQIENSEKLKANPLLYLVSPQVKDWFSRQQLVLIVLVINIALALMFFKMLT